ncbi:MOP flippase family protein [Rathayibacter sp. ZW T2_19]|uniref:MOP flippase family protein n=1 Tax=Rathayibacter rubneri TaxID=2950106 RepID=A0A9X2DXF5_9MICO|nr:MOP flippase family protein [Rathayibacter rubneri]MCM6761086.1 MOP flippase family protein [Rathayibacter rubneri]
MGMRGTVVGAARWTTASVAVTFGLQFAQYLLLARLLGPHDVGLVAIVTVLVGFADIFLGMGLTQALIQRRVVTSFEVSSVFWLNLAWALVVAAVVFVAAYPLAAFYGEPEAVGLVQLGSVVFLLSAFGQTSLAMLEKRLRFRAIAAAEVAAAVAGFTAVAVLASLGLGALSAVIGLLLAATVKNVWYRVAARRSVFFRARFRLSETRRFLSFGLLQSLDSVLNFANANLSTIAAGRFVSVAAMGGYNLAFSSVVTTPTRINPIITRVMFPVFSRMQDDTEGMARTFLKTLTLTGLLSIPPLLAVSVVSREFVAVAFGPNWSWLPPVVSILCFVGILRSVGNPVGFLVMATDNLRLGLRINVLKTSVTIPLILLGAATMGVTGAAYGLLAAQVIGYFIAYRVVRVVLGVTFVRYTWSTVLPAVLATPMLVVLVVLQALLPNVWPAVALLAIKGAVSVAVLLVTLGLARTPVIVEIRNLVLQQLPNRRPRARSGTVVILPVVERLDGTGGAVATWVARVYAHLDDYVIVAPAARSAYAEELATADLRSFERLRRMILRAAEWVQPITRKSPRSVHDRLLLGGGIYLRAAAPWVDRAAVAHIHNRPLYAAALRRRGFEGRIVVHMHNDLHDYLPPRRRAEVLEAVDAWLFCSDYLRDRAIDEFGLTEAQTIYNGIETSSTAVHGPKQGLVFAGRVVEEKGVLEAIQVVEHLRRESAVTLDIYGGPGNGTNDSSTDYYDLVLRRAAELNRRTGQEVVRLHGRQDHADLLAALASHSVFVYPCSWEEPFGMVLAEAMSVGTPVVAYARGGIPEVVGDVGVLVPGDRGIEEFARSVAALLRSSEYDDICRRSREHVNRTLAWESIAERTRSLVGAGPEGRSGPVSPGG